MAELLSLSPADRLLHASDGMSPRLLQLPHPVLVMDGERFTRLAHQLRTPPELQHQPPCRGGLVEATMTTQQARQ